MKNVDFSAIIVSYNFVIGVLVYLASERITAFAGVVGISPESNTQRYARTALRAFGGTVAVLSATIYLLFHLLRLGVD